MEIPPWLTKEEKELWKATVPFIPDYDPCLDRAVLTIYVVTLQQVIDLKQELAGDLNDETRTILKKILRDYENILQELAPELGLTPWSRLEITKVFKQKKRSR